MAMQELGLQPHVLLDTPFAAFLPELPRQTPTIAVMPDNEILDLPHDDLPVREIANTFLQFRSAVIWHKSSSLSPAAAKVVELLGSQKM